MFSMPAEEYYSEFYRIDGSAFTQKDQGKKHHNSNLTQKKDSTEICRYFTEGGFCRNGDKCAYLHTAICRYFSKDGNCKYGENCRYQHLDNCKYFAKGKCNKGEKCAYRHVNPQKNVVSNKNSRSIVPELRKSQPVRKLSTICRYFSNGNCKYGNSCKYLHVKNFQTNPPQSQQNCTAFPRNPTNQNRYFSVDQAVQVDLGQFRQQQQQQGQFRQQQCYQRNQAVQGCQGNPTNQPRVLLVTQDYPTNRTDFSPALPSQGNPGNPGYQTFQGTQAF